MITSVRFVLNYVKHHAVSEDAFVMSPGLVESVIFLIRGRRVILDPDLAELYGVTTTRRNEQVRRNP